jgi:hypothetical protein
MDIDKFIEQIPLLNVKDRVKYIHDDNIEKVYKLNYSKFVFLYSDNVWIDGKEISKDNLQRQMILLSDKLDFEACRTIKGMELTELDFINKELQILDKGKDLVKDLVLTKKIKLYYDYLISKKASLEKPKPEKKLISFVWQNNAENELPELYSLMLDKYKLIAPETTLEQFTAIFTGQPIETIEPVRWHQDNASELLYFYIQLSASTNIDGNPNKLNYQKLAACFVKPDGQPYEASFKQLKTHIEISLSDEKKNNISSLIKEF